MFDDGSPLRSYTDAKANTRPEMIYNNIVAIEEVQCPRLFATRFGKTF